jgi:hypothetical protein
VIDNIEKPTENRYDNGAPEARMNGDSGVRLLLPTAAFVLYLLIGGISSLQLGQSAGLPEQISDQEFWRMVTDLSEPSGPYTGDNWISNEASIQDVIPPLKQLTTPGGH